MLILNHFEVFNINNYRVTSSISDRYVQNEVALVVENQNMASDETYVFDVDLDEYEFISSFSFRVGDDGPVKTGNL